MGFPMARRLVAAGYPVTGYDIGEQARREFAESTANAAVAGDVRRACDGADGVILMLPDSAAVASVLEGSGVLCALPARTVVVDMGSSEPTETRRLAERAEALGVRFVDAPVSGGVAGAEDGRLTIMVGGRRDDVDEVRPVLEVLGGNVLYVGPSGAGHAVKALNNLLSAAHLLATSEAMLAAQAFGLDLRSVLDAINSSSGRSGSTESKWPNFVLTERFDSGFALRLMVKDMKIATGLARATGHSTPFADVAVELWEAAASALPETADHTEIARWVQQRVGQAACRQKGTRMTDNSRFEQGLAIRKDVLGAEHVERSLAEANDFNMAMQELVTEYCWGAVWGREGLDRRTRSLMNVAMLAALNRQHELGLHVRGALTNGCSPEEIREALLQVAIYAGIPAGVEGFRTAGPIVQAAHSE
jgi:3-hydroxyisobutyrate dehydrogenase